jgi:uncharacterized membrane protein
VIDNTNERSRSANSHEEHTEKLGYGGRLADAVAKRMGSWSFIIVQTFIVLVWMLINLIGCFHHWDVYPFILLNLLFSIQAAYAAPVIMMAQNRQSERDRAQAAADFDTNLEAKEEIENLQMKLNKIEIEKLDKIIELLQKLTKGAIILPQLNTNKILK